MRLFNAAFKFKTKITGCHIPVFSHSTHFQFSVSILFQMSLAASNRQLTKMNEQICSVSLLLLFPWATNQLYATYVWIARHGFRILFNWKSVQCCHHLFTTCSENNSFCCVFVQFGLYADYKLSIPCSISLLSLHWIACCFFCCCRFVTMVAFHQTGHKWNLHYLKLFETCLSMAAKYNHGTITMNIVFTISY